jgi:uncharacterized protein (TIGR02266 family)
MGDARKDRRTLLSLKIRYKSATLEDFIERYSNDISRGGIFIKAKKPLAVGTLLKFEFILQDQSTLIHGVGRVVWRRDEAEADTDNPSGMGIKFIKMDPESRSIVQRIAEGRGHPGVFEQGKDGVRQGSAGAPDPNSLGTADLTKVRHVSEFLSSALEEGGAGEAAKRAARAGAERARQVGDQIGGNRAAAARGAFSAKQEVPTQKRHSASGEPARGAKSAFGGAAMSASTRVGSAAAPSMVQFGELDDFLDDETTKIQDFSGSDYPDADSTVISTEAAAPFVAERRRTPVVPVASSLQHAVPDLFGPAAADSFGPAPGEFIDASLLDPSVVTVPPPRAAVPYAPGIPAEAFRVPQATEPVWTTRPTVKKKRSRGWMLLLFVLFLAAVAVAAWQLGLAHELIDLAAPYLRQSEHTVQVPVQTVKPRVQPAAEPKRASAEAPPSKPESAANEAVPTPPSEPAAEAAAAPIKAAEIGMVKFQVVSRPPGAFVSVDGKGVGRAPVEIEYGTGTQLTLHAKARGYLARRQQITVRADQATVELALPPLAYVVEVISNPAGARASAVGAGEVTTPGELQFKSMPASRQIVISMDGYKTVSKYITRAEFVEQTRRMAATISVTLQKEGGAKPDETAPSAKAVTPPPAEVKTPVAEVKPAVEKASEPDAKPVPNEVKAEPEAAVVPRAVEAAPAPSETPVVDEP